MIRTPYRTETFRAARALVAINQERTTGMYVVTCTHCREWSARRGFQGEARATAREHAEAHAERHLHP